MIDITYFANRAQVELATKTGLAETDNSQRERNLAARFSRVSHKSAGVGCVGKIIARQFESPGERKMALVCKECGLNVGTINAGILEDLLSA